MAKQKRDNDYLMCRLEKEHPTIFADWKAGKFPSPRQALIAAGLRQPEKQLNILRNAWSKASATERADFLKWIGLAGGPAPAITSPNVAASTKKAKSGVRSISSRSTLPGSPVTQTGHLKPWALTRITQIMDARRMKMGEVMKEMGFKPLDASLGRARRDLDPSTISNDLALALSKWLDDNKAVK